MKNSKKDKKKAIVLFLFAFLFFGGGTFLFFISEGIKDLRSNDPSARFSYSYQFREALLPIFKNLGFTEDGVLPAGKTDSAIKLVSNEEFEEIAAARASADSNSAGRNKKKEKFTGSTKIPKMPSKKSGLKRGSASTKSSAKIAGFSENASKNDVSVNKNSLAMNVKDSKQDAFNRMKSTERILRGTNYTRSGAKARSQWNRSFQGKGKAGGFINYGKKGIRLDDIGPSSLIESLKEAKEKTLNAPDVGKPKKLKSSKSAASIAKDAAKKAMTDGVLGSVKNIGKGIAGGIRDKDESNLPLELPPDLGPEIDVMRQPGETTIVTKVPCADNPSACAELKVAPTGNIWKVDYPNEPALTEVFTEGQNGVQYVMGGFLP